MVRKGEQPDYIQVGAGVILRSVGGLAEDWGIDVPSIIVALNTMGLPRIAFPGGPKRYVSLYPLEDWLFEHGLPEAYKKDKTLVRAHHELAGVLYGTLTREVIRERVKALARTLKTGKTGLTSTQKRAKIQRNKRWRDAHPREHGYEYE